jgi:hypothetical protein
VGRSLTGAGQENRRFPRDFPWFGVACDSIATEVPPKRKQRPAKNAAEPAHQRDCTPENIQLLGAASTCNCITLDEFPIVVPAHGSTRVAVSLSYSGESDLSKQEVTFYTNVIDESRLVGVVKGSLTRSGSTVN